MHNCEYCDRGFKTIQGLLGHQRMKHSGSAGPSAAERSVEYSPSAAQNSQFNTDQHSGSTAQNRVVLAASEDHSHESSCSGCQQMAQETYGQGRVAGIEEIAEIPGVREAIAFACDSERWNEKHPDHPTIANWASVAGVLELAQDSRPSLISITRAEESSPDNRVVRVVRTPVGEIIAQNGKRNSE